MLSEESTTRHGSRITPSLSRAKAIKSDYERASLYRKAGKVLIVSTIREYRGGRRRRRRPSTMEHEGARFRESEVNVPGSGYKHQGLAGGPFLLFPSPAGTQVAGRTARGRRTKLL